LRSLAAVRALTPEEAAAQRPVTVEATVLGHDPATPWNLFVHDGTAGCYINLKPGPEPPHFPPGTRVRIAGVSRPLGYYPSISQGVATVLGKAELPPPLRLQPQDIHQPQLDSAWVEVAAVVVGFEVRDGRLTLDIEVHGRPFKAELPMAAGAEERASALMQHAVVLRGVLGTIFNRQRQMTDRHFFLSSLDAITPAPLPAAGEDAPLVPITRLLTAGFGPQTPVRVRGIVTQLHRQGFYLRDASGATRVDAAPPGRFAPGSPVEVEGFGGVAPFRPVLRATRLAPGSPANLPAGTPLPLPEDRAQWPALHFERVTLEAVLLTRQEGRAETALECQFGSHIFEALLPFAETGAARPQPGDRVRIAGVCELTTTHPLPRIGWVDGFRIHVAQPEDIVLVARAPWWTARRLAIALGVTSALAAMGLAGTWMLRRRVSHQLAIIGDQLRNEAVAKERDRMARDLHDTLEQNLSGVALQLDGVDAAVQGDPPTATRALHLARRMLRHARLEARRSVWDLRSQVLERHGLAAALHAMADASTGPSGPRILVGITGAARPLPPAVEFHLFRIAQEALANALKHARAHAIRIRIDYAPAFSRVSVTDDGRGFDLLTQDAASGRHFGLLGMRDRAARIGAELHVDSAPGQGCTLTVQVPFTVPP
jgi:signal transduction histidine kinase